MLFESVFLGVVGRWDMRIYLCAVMGRITIHEFGYISEGRSILWNILRQRWIYRKSEMSESGCERSKSYH